MSNWHLYLIRTDSGALYTGISTNVEKRFEVHSLGRGSKFLRGQQPAALVYQCLIGERSTASQAEYRLKQLEKSLKEKLVADQPNRAALLSHLGIE